MTTNGAPRRIRLHRTAGWRKPKGAVVVARPSKWGNPIRWQDSPTIGHDSEGEPFRISDTGRRRFAVIDFEAALRGWDGTPAGQIAGRSYPTVEEIRRELAGKDLACWCPMDQPCHADVLLAVANSDGDTR